MLLISLNGFVSATVTDQSVLIMDRSVFCLSYVAGAVFPVEPVGPTLDAKQQPDACAQEVLAVHLQNKIMKTTEEEFEHTSLILKFFSSLLNILATNNIYLILGLITIISYQIHIM